MTEFRCDVIDPDGRKIQLARQAASEALCVKELLSQGFTPLSVRSGPLTIAEMLNRPVRLGGTAGTSDQAVFLRQLAILINADLPVDRSLDLLRDQAGSRRQTQLLTDMLGDVRAGQSLANALEARRQFPDWVVGVIRSAETGGGLGTTLTSVADRMGILAATRRRLISALTYPAAVLIATIAALIIVLTLVVPEFEPIFAGSEDKLPSMTLFVLALSKNAAAWGTGVVSGTIALSVILYIFLKSEAGGMLREQNPHLFPGQRLRDQYLAAQFSGLLSTLLLNGVNAVAALALVRDAMPSARWRRQLGSALSRVREGEKLSVALSKAPAFPITARRLVEVGENSGKLGEACREAGKIIGEIASQRIENIVSLVNPVAIILLGGVVAILVAGVMLGIFALGDFAG